MTVDKKRLSVRYEPPVPYVDDFLTGLSGRRATVFWEGTAVWSAERWPTRIVRWYRQLSVLIETSTGAVETCFLVDPEPPIDPKFARKLERAGIEFQAPPWQKRAQ